MRNIDKIKKMTLDEMAGFLEETPCLHCTKFKTNKCDAKNCIEHIAQWLQQEVSE
jgi:hypothetical protein